MKFDVVVPPAGETFVTCRLAKWHKGHNTLVKAGECIATLATDKIVSELEAQYSGALLHKVDEGATLNVGQIFGEIDEEGVTLSDLNKIPFAHRQDDEDADTTSWGLPFFWLVAKRFLMILGLIELFRMLTS